MEIEKTCFNCDKSYEHRWGGIRKHEPCECNRLYNKFILRRDKRSCDNCNAHGCYLCRIGDLNNWKPITEKEPTKYKFTGCFKCYYEKVPHNRHPCKGCGANKHENFRLKQEGNVEKSCGTCDYDGAREWNNVHNCPKNDPEKAGCNDRYDYYKWKLRRDYNQENKEQEMFYLCEKCQHKGNPMRNNVGPVLCPLPKGYGGGCIHYENKEQEMSYKPTSKCTLKNIIDIAYASNCSDVYKNVVDVLNAHMINNYDLPGRNQEIDAGSPFFLMMTDRSDKCKWLTGKGIIEEEISLKPCPFCNSTDLKLIKSVDMYIRCRGCDTNGPDGKDEKEAIKAWNTRK